MGRPYNRPYYNIPVKQARTVRAAAATVAKI